MSYSRGYVNTMHEYSIVQALLNQCEEISAKHNASRVDRIICKIGVMSGVEVHLFEIAFNTFKEGTICGGAELVIDRQNLILSCEECGSEFESSEPIYICRSCNSPLRVLDGEDIYLMSLEMV